VHGCGQLDGVAFLDAQAQLLGNQARVLGHADNVVAGFLVTVFTGLCQAQQGFVFARQDLAGGFVDLLLQPAGPFVNDALLATLGQQVAAAGVELQIVDRRAEQVGGAGIQHLASGRAVSPGCHHDHWQMIAFRDLAQPLYQADYVEFGKLTIGNHQVGGVPVQPGKGRLRLEKSFDVDGGVQAPAQGDKAVPAGYIPIHDEYRWHTCLVSPVLHSSIALLRSFRADRHARESYSLRC